MKKLALLLATSSIACGASGPEFQEFDGEAAYRYVQQQVDFGPRVPNTAGHRNAGDWIQQRLEATTDSVEVQQWVHVTAAGDSLRMRNFIGRFKPEERNRVLYLAHWDTRPRADKSPNLGQQQLPVPGANDGGSGVAILLGVADALAATPPNWGVDLLFVDGEDYGVFAEEVDVLIGSRYFAANLPADYAPLFGILFDMVGGADLTILQEGNSVLGAPEVVTRVWQQARDIGYGRVFRNSNQGAITDDHVPLLEAGLRVINIIDLNGYSAYWHTTEDTPDKVSTESLQIVGDVAMALLR